MKHLQYRWKEGLATACQLASFVLYNKKISTV